jgi:hypothetical protein
MKAASLAMILTTLVAIPACKHRNVKEVEANPELVSHTGPKEPKEHSAHSDSSLAIATPAGNHRSPKTLRPPDKLRMPDMENLPNENDLKSVKSVDSSPGGIIARPPAE